MTPDSQGTPAVVFDGTQKERIEIPNTAGSLDVDLLDPGSVHAAPVGGYRSRPPAAVATYDGAHLRTYVADGDGTNLALDRSVAQTGTLDTGATITGVDEKLVVGAKHRKGHAPGGSGASEDAEAFFNGTMSRFIVYDTALTQSQISSVILDPGSSAKRAPCTPTSSSGRP